MMLNLPKVRSNFPILNNGLIYLDSAATAQIPSAVIDSMSDFYRTCNANVHRGLYPLSEKATEGFESARESVRSFINAKSAQEMVFTHGCTESLNLIAKSWGKANLKKSDTVVLSILEHHSAITPWLQLKDEIGIGVEWIDIR